MLDIYAGLRTAHMRGSQLPWTACHASQRRCAVPVHGDFIPDLEPVNLALVCRTGQAGRHSLRGIESCSTGDFRRSLDSEA
jgi:hypothetical protein